MLSRQFYRVGCGRFSAGDLNHVIINATLKTKQTKLNSHIFSHLNWVWIWLTPLVRTYSTSWSNTFTAIRLFPLRLNASSGFAVNSRVTPGWTVIVCTIAPTMLFSGKSTRVGASQTVGREEEMDQFDLCVSSTKIGCLLKQIKTLKFYTYRGPD